MGKKKPLLVIPADKENSCGLGNRLFYASLDPNSHTGIQLHSAIELQSVSLESLLLSRSNGQEWDTRIRVKKQHRFPWRLHGQLELVFHKPTIEDPNRLLIYLGTGFLIGPDLILTAAHNLYHLEDEKQTCRGITFYSSREGVGEVAYGAKEMFFPKQYLTGNPPHRKRNHEYDVGIIQLTEELKSPHYYTPIALTPKKLYNQDVRVTGYPQTRGTLLTGTGEIKGVGLQRSHSLRHTVPTTPGQSGSAIVLGKGVHALDCVGIHTYGKGDHAYRLRHEKTNGGIYFTQKLLGMIDKWKEELSSG